MKNDKLKNTIIIAITVSSVITMFFLEPIAQDPSYHLFVDGRTIFGIANFWNVLSNLPFLFVGLMGLKSIYYSKNTTLHPELKTASVIFFTGISLVAFGSGYYHLSPNNETLLWDRLPMTIAFMALFTIVIGEFISINLAKRLLLPLLIIGAFSVLYWFYSETQSQGDLRPYVLVQFLPMLLIPLILLIFKPTFSLTSGYWWLLAAYILAKFLEYFDQHIFSLLPFISGHSLKHFAAALGVWMLLRAYRNRELS